MQGQLSHYDILGVTAGASADDVQRSYAAKMAVLAPGMIAGAPSKVVAAAGRAQDALELARRTLTDPASRHRYDEDSGVLRIGGGLARSPAVPSAGDWTWNSTFWADPDAPTEYLGVIADWLAPGPGLARYVTVPNARALFVVPARRLMVSCGLHVELVQLTPRPMPVEGLVVDQSAKPGARVRRASTVAIQVWHPSQQIRRRA